MGYKEKYKEWLENPFFDKETKEELQNLEDKEIQERFHKELEFGTAGLRGIMGAGTNRMNRYTVGKTTQGLANVIKKEQKEQKGVVIAYDSRNHSKEFSEVVALCLNGNGIKTYIFEDLRPVPELSYAVRELGAVAGIMITASHNPPKYNGYKVYGEDGAQITSPKDKEIIEQVSKIKDYIDIKMITKEEAEKKHLYHVIGKEIDDKYRQQLKKQIVNPEAIKRQKNLKIVYTPLHGTGNIPVRTVLEEIGFEQVYIVKEQELPDGNFPTVDYPNPEDKNAFKLALDLARKVEAEIVLATDPDADRLGVYARDSRTGEYKPFTGNMSALLIAEYIFSQKKQKKELPANGAMIKSIVSSTLANAIAKEYDIKLFEVLTGFKYIGEKMKEFDQTKEYKYLFGFEESYGCLVGTHARDKDSIVAVMLLCEAAAYYKEQGLTLWDQMLKIYEKYGYYKETIVTHSFEGIEGFEKMQNIMKQLRENPPKLLGEYEVIEIRDYQTQKQMNIKTKEERFIDLPKSNVLYYKLDKDAWFCIRPSGTEPKIKYYIGVKGTSLENAQKQIDQLQQDIQTIG